MVTSALMILLTNSAPTTITLVSCKVTNSTSTAAIELPTHVAQGTYGAVEFPESDTPYAADWTYTPDGGHTLLSFATQLSGKTGITITPSRSGPQAHAWQLAEQPAFTNEGWLVRYFYAAAS